MVPISTIYVSKKKNQCLIYSFIAFLRDKSGTKLSMITTSHLSRKGHLSLIASSIGFQASAPTIVYHPWLSGIFGWHETIWYLKILLLPSILLLLGLLVCIRFGKIPTHPKRKQKFLLILPLLKILLRDGSMVHPNVVVHWVVQGVWLKWLKTLSTNGPSTMAWAPTQGHNCWVPGNHFT